uniref:Uncharacterized protein n=1 Tax=Setaria italica TaxID=4555 RepID=K4AP18_SETIT
MLWHRYLTKRKFDCTMILKPTYLPFMDIMFSI